MKLRKEEIEIVCVRKEEFSEIRRWGGGEGSFSEIRELGRD